MKYETSIAVGLHGEHKIESDNVLLCAETGRVIAVFYNNYDLADFTEMNEVYEKSVINRDKTIEALKASNAKMKEILAAHKTF